MEKNNTIGVLMLNTQFPRLPGDIGNPDSFRYPVKYCTVESAIPANVTTASVLSESLQEEFCKAANSLITQQVSLITTSCGFLTTMQNRLSNLSNTPVICSALCLLPLLEILHGGSDKLGVLTFNRDTLNQNHFPGSGTGTPPFAIEGLLATDTLRQVIQQDLKELNRDAAQQEVIAAADRLLTINPHTEGIVLECTNLSPYKKALKDHTRTAVYDIVDAVHWLIKSQPNLS